MALINWVKRLFPDYKSLVGYLHRTTLLKVGRLHIRLHRILSPDATPFLHSHPFDYLSIIVRGGYTERTESGLKKYGVGSLLFRSHKTHHRLEAVEPNTLTIFITFKRDGGWSIKKTLECPDWIQYDTGVYKRKLFGKIRFCKFDQFWHTAADSEEQALASTKPSIDQTTPPWSEHA